MLYYGYFINSYWLTVATIPSTSLLLNAHCSTGYSKELKLYNSYFSLAPQGGYTEE